MFPVTVTADIQLLFTQALFFRQKLLGVEQTAFIPIPAEMDHDGKYLEVDQSIRMRFPVNVRRSPVRPVPWNFLRRIIRLTACCWT